MRTSPLRKISKRKEALGQRYSLKRSAIKRKPRKKSERERIYGPKGYVEWIHEQPCVACGWTPSECAHIRTGGTGRKDDWTRTIPLCGPHIDHRYTKITIGCHKLYDLKMRVIPFNTTPEKLAAENHSRWQEFVALGSSKPMEK